MKMVIKKGILFGAVIGLISCADIVGESRVNAAVADITGQKVASKRAGAIRVGNPTPHKVYIRIEYVDPGILKKTPAADYFYVEAGQSWEGGKQAPIKGITGYIYLPSGQTDLVVYKRDNAFGDAKNSRNFDIKEVQGFWGNYQVLPQ